MLFEENRGLEETETTRVIFIDHSNEKGPVQTAKSRRQIVGRHVGAEVADITTSWHLLYPNMILIVRLRAEFQNQRPGQR